MFKKIEKKIIGEDIQEGIEMYLERYDEFELLYPDYYHKLYKEIEQYSDVDYDYDKSHDHSLSRVKKIDMNSIYDVKTKRKKAIENIISEKPDNVTRIEDFLK